MDRKRLWVSQGNQTGFTPEEKQVVGGLIALLTLRMLGFYLVLPVLTPYVRTLTGSTAMLVGLSVGVYGLTQTIFQVPFGAWSDRWGRRRVLTVGLILFAAGSAVCAIATSAWIMVLGRLVQGTGAIASVVVATIGDLTRDRVRTRAMALVGISIGGSFAVGLLLGPSATENFGIPSLFWFTAALTLLGIGWLWWKIPDPPVLSHHADVEYSTEHLFEVLRNRQLQRLDFGTFNLHMTLTAIFVTIPILLQELIAPGHQWRLFLPLLTMGLTVMLLGPRLSEGRDRGRGVALLGQGLMAAAMVVFAVSVPSTVQMPMAALTGLVIALFLFTSSFALLEPLFPALLTRISHQANRGTAAGIFNMSQFSGAFVGGLLSGWFLERNLEALYWLLAASGVLWFLAALRLEDPEHLSVIAVGAGDLDPDRRREMVRRLLKVGGVEDVAYEKADGRILVRFAADRVDAERLEAAAAGQTLEAG